MSWTTLFHGVTHFGELRDTHRLTVTVSGHSATLLKWYPGCAFHPIEEHHDTEREAKEAGEKWLKEQR